MPEIDRKDLTLKNISLHYFSTTVLCNIPVMNNLILSTACLKTNPEMSRIRNMKDFQKIESKAKKLLSKMPEMGIYKNMILEMLFPITCRIHRWKIKYADAIDNEYLNYFYWTYQGRIDNKRTAKYIIENTMIPITKRFVLACCFCLVGEIIKIWTEMSNDDRSVLKEGHYGDFQCLCLFWIKIMTSEMHERIQNMDLAIDSALTNGSIYTIQYLFHLMPVDGKAEKAFSSFGVLSTIIRKPCYCFHEDFTEAGYFLHCEMNGNHRNYLYSFDLFVLLTLLLYPPGQSEFLRKFKYNIHRISESSIKQLLIHIISKISMDAYRDYEYFQLFIGIWKLLPKETLMNIKDDSFLLEYGFCKTVCKHFRFILIKNRSKKTKNTNIFENRFVFNQDKCKLLQFLIKKEIVTIESLKHNKTKVLKFLNIRKSNKPAWRRLLKFVKDNGPQRRK